MNTLAAFLDIEGALNNVTPTVITGALTELGIERPIVGLIHTMLTSRVVYSTMGSALSTRNVSRGTPQGGVLSPLLSVSLTEWRALTIGSRIAQAKRHCGSAEWVHHSCGT